MMSLFKYYPTLRRVIVNTRTGRTFRGMLWQKRLRYLVLKDVEMLKERGESRPVDGEVVIERSNVDFIQVLGE